MIRILHLADIHLGARLQHIPDEQKRIELCQDLKRSFQKIIDFCLAPESRIDIVLICGNLFNSHIPEVQIFEFAKQQIDKLIAQRITVFIVPGGFDSNNYVNSIYKDAYFAQNVNLITEANVAHIQTLDINGEQINIFGMNCSHFTREPADEIFRSDLPGYHIALIHDATVYGEPFIRIEKLLKSGFDYVALGGSANFNHYEQKGVHVVFPGMLEPITMTAQAPRTLCIVECHQQKLKILSLQNKFNNKQFTEIKIDLAHHQFSSEKDIASYLEEKYTNYAHLVRLILTGKIAFLIDATRLKQRLDHFFFDVTVDDQTTFLYQDFCAKTAKNNSIPALYLKKITGFLESAKTEESSKKILQAMKIGLAIHEN
jgi:DNA repair exonuclease SbcCD nuclease subunit